MGIYVYGLKKKTRTHPVFGEVGVLHYIYKPYIRSTPEQEKWENDKDAYYRSNWENREVPRYVVFEDDKEFEEVHLYSGGATWADCNENLCVPMKRVGL